MNPPKPTNLSRLSTIPVAALAVSWAAIFIRYAESEALVTAFYRMAFATVFLLPWLAGPGRKALTNIPRGVLSRCVLSGFFLALHFAFWISSLDFTPVANSVVLVSSAPIFAAMFSRLFLREKPHTLSFLAIGVALLGAVIITGGDFQWAPDQLRGDIYAIAGAVAVAGYFIMGRLIQRKVGILTYISLTYASSAVFLGLIAAAFGQRFAGFPAMTWLWLALLGLVPTVIGHTLYNRALRFFPAHVVGVSVLAEPIGATILALLLLSEHPPWYAIIGAVPILIGVGWVFWLERDR